MEFFYVVKATQKSGKQDAVIWFTAKTDTRASLLLDVELEEAGIETGRGKDYSKPIRTDMPVVDDLPEESVIDFTWCDRYALQEDGRTWLPSVIDAPVVSNQEPDASVKVDDTAARKDFPLVQAGDENDENTKFQLTTMPFRTQLLAQFMAAESHVYHISIPHRRELTALEMDTDNSYIQNLLLTAQNSDELKKFDIKDLWRYTNAIRTVFDSTKRHELNAMLQFTRAWIDTAYIDRGILVKEWASGKRVAAIKRTDTGTNAGGGNKTDRNPDYVHTLDTLDVEIALATLPMDFNIYDIPGGVYRRAKEIVAKKESPFKEWSAALRKCAGILDYSRAAIFALIRGAANNAHHFPVSLQTYINANLTESNHEFPTDEILAAAGHAPDVSWENEINEQAIAETRVTDKQPKVESLGGGVFSIKGLTGAKENPVTIPPSNEVAKQEVEKADNVQMEEAQPEKIEVTDAVSPGESADAADPQAVTLTSTEILAANAPHLADPVETDTYQNTEIPHQTEPDAEHKQPEAEQIEPLVQEPEPPVPEFPAYFEPGRYVGLPNEVYHAANGISSTQVKDARVSLMYFNARHVEKTIQKERSKVLDMGNLVHALALQPENLDEEFSVEPVIPEGAFTTAATLRTFIDEHNASLPALLSADEIKALLEEHNATLPAQVPIGDDVTQTGENYISLPAAFQRVEEGQKVTAAKMKACIKEYNATLPAPMKTSGSRDALLEQLATINPDLVAQEAQKPLPLKVSGTKADLIQAVKSVNPDAVFADELLDAWRENPGNKILVTLQQMESALAIQKALHQHPTAGMLLLHPDRAVETSYFGIDDETGLEIRVRPDLELDVDGVRIGADLKTISMWNVKQSGLRAKLHREIIDRDYHLSAAMYMQTAGLDQFFWIFVNKDEGYHWIAIVEASEELIELGMLEYRQTMNRIADAFDTGVWPAPITEDYTDELNDFDLRRLEALRLA